MLRKSNISVEGIKNVKNKTKNEGVGTKRYKIVRLLNTLEMKNKITKRIVHNRISRKTGMWPPRKILDMEIPIREEKHKISDELKHKIRKKYKADWEEVEKYVKNI